MLRSLNVQSFCPCERHSAEQDRGRWTYGAMFESRALIVEFEERQCAMCRSRLSFMRGIIAAGNAARREVIVSRGGRQVSGICEEDIEGLFVVPWAGLEIR